MLHTPEQKITVNGIQLNFDSFGDSVNPPLILIMGLATQMIFWDETFCCKIAEQGFWVIRFDNRDVGKSSWINDAKVPGTMAFILNVLLNKNLKSAYQLSDMVNDTLGLMDVLEIKKAHIVGASMGGMIAQILALQNPQRVASLTSIMSTTGNRSLPRPTNKTVLQLFSPPAKDLKVYLTQATAIWRILHGNFFLFEEQKIRNLLLESRQRGFNPEGVSRQFGAILASHDRTAELGSLQIPTLVLHGEDDPLLPVECGIATAKAIPNARLKIFKGMGHTLPSQLYNELINEIVLITRQAC